MDNPSSYTFALSDRAGTNIYSPYGDGPVSSGWQAFPNSHNTMAPNASLRFSWKGTAITIGGFVNSTQGPPAFMFSLDGQPPTREVVDEGRTNAEVLLSKTGLPLAYHTIVLSNIAGGNLTVKKLQPTISTGVKYSRWILTQRTIDTTIGTGSIYTPNSFFTFNGNWFPREVSSMPSVVTTATDNSSSVLSFTLSECSAFFLYGPMMPQSGAPYNVKITPPVRPQDSSSLALNSTLGRVLGTASQEEILFWESGMDRNKKYTFEIKILPGPGQWGVSKLETFDAELFPSNDDTFSSSNNKTLFLVIIIAPTVGFFIAILCWVWYFKKVRQQGEIVCVLHKKT